MSHRGKKKSGDLKVHFNKRCIERLGHGLNTDQLKKDLEAGNLKFVEKQSNTRSIFEYVENGVNYHLVYDKPRKEFTTILYADHNSYIDQMNELYEKMMFGD